MMREIEERPTTCSYCGAPAEYLSSAEAATVVGLKLWRLPDTHALANVVERQRSGLAYAAAFAGLFYLFRYSFATFLFTYLGLSLPVGESLVMLWSLSAPVALILSYIAGASLDRTPEKSGAAAAMLGLLIGLIGSIAWLAGFDRLWLEMYALR
jgi:hypothetical protein